MRPPRPSITTAIRRPNFNRATSSTRFASNGWSVERHPGRRAGHLYHGTLRRDDARRSWRGRHQGRKPGGRSIPQLSRRPVLAVFDGLVREADVFIQNFRPGTATRLGAGPERLCVINPRLIYTSISGFGSSGPYAERPRYDSVAQALSGFLSVVVDSSRPRFLGPALADAITGIYAAYGVLGALVQRGRTGQGSLVEVSMLEAMAHFALEPFAAFFALGTTPTSSDRPRLAQAYILHTADGRLIAIHLSSLDKFWDGLVSALEAPELAVDARFSTRQSRITHYESLNAELDKIFARHALSH